MTVLVVAPHPDDEVLGAGGAMARFADAGHSVVVAIVTKGDAELFDPALIEQGRREAPRAHRVLGVGDAVFLDLPAAKLDLVPHHELNEALGRVIREVDPDVLFVPFRGDVHLDHRLVFDSALVAARPSQGLRVNEILAYETLSETNWNAPQATGARFSPDLFIRIDHQLNRKLEAMAMYSSQLREWPHERSLRAIEALARLRGATVGAEAAEAFVTVRRVL